MLQNYSVDITDFLSLTNAGLKSASFVQVREAIIKRYKSAYGSDIDLSSGTADGIFINDLALIMNNILKTVETMYANLDVNYASGAYLDLLCRLSNIQRKQATRSIANVLIKNLSATPTVLSARFKVFDVTGQQWTGSNNEITLSPRDEQGSEANITVTCDTEGQIQAPAGSIKNAIDASLNISITQEKDASVGSLIESDSDLRERRAQSNGAQGLTVLETLYGALRAITTIRDVKIYNNASSFDLPSSGNEEAAPLDGTVIPAHNIYVIIRVQPLTQLSESEIGQLIYEKLTPGICTTEFVGSQDDGNKHYDYIPTAIGTTIELFTQRVYWKECVPIHPALDVTINIEDYFDADINDEVSPEELAKRGTFALIVKNLINYLNDLSIGVKPSENDIRYQVSESDPLFKTRPTFFVSNVGVIADNPDTYYDYSSAKVEHVSGKQYKITIM